MKVLVTGGAGYIGSHTVAELLAEGHAVITLDNLAKGHREAVLSGKFIKADLANRRALDEVFAKNRIDAVIHFAAYSLVEESVKNPQKYFRNNVEASANLIAVMLRHGVKKMIFSSTAAVYGEAKRMPIRESALAKPANPYGKTKLMVEKMLAACDKAYGLKYVSLRYFNAAGAHKSGKIGEDHSPETHLIPVVLQTALGQRPYVQIFGDDYKTKDGTCVRDYIHVADLAVAHILALHKLKSGWSAIYNLGNSVGFSVREIIHAAERVTGKKIKVKIGRRRQGDPTTLIASSEKIKKNLGWRPKYQDINTIIETAWQWHRKHPRGFRK